MFSKKDNTSSKFERYSDPTGEFSNRNLKFATWYIQHKVLLRKIVIGVLVIWNVATIGTGLYVWGKYAVWDYFEDNKKIESIAYTYIPHSDIVRRISPRALQVGQARVLPSTEDRYDLVSRVTNPNASWIAHVTYEYMYNGNAIATQKATILPDEETLLVAYAVESSGTPRSTQLRITHTDWKRVSPHDVPKPREFIDERSSFSVENVDFVSANRSLGFTTHQIRFDMINTGLFSFWEGDFTVVYLDRQEMVGVAPIHLSQVRAGEMRTIELASLVDGLTVDDILIKSHINVFDAGVYMPL